MRSKRPLRSLIVCVSCAMVGCILTSTAYSRRVNDLETERDIYASKSSNWERMAGERDETIDQLQTEVDKEFRKQQLNFIKRVRAQTLGRIAATAQPVNVLAEQGVQDKVQLIMQQVSQQSFERRRRR